MKLPELIVLNLSYTNITEEAFKDIEGLPKLKLRKLDLSGTEITNDALEDIGRAFPELTVLNLSGAKITKGVFDVFEDIEGEVFQELTKLDLSKTEITAEDVDETIRERIKILLPKLKRIIVGQGTAITICLR